MNYRLEHYDNLKYIVFDVLNQPNIDYVFLCENIVMRDLMIKEVQSLALQHGILSDTELHNRFAWRNNPRQSNLFTAYNNKFVLFENGVTIQLIQYEDRLVQTSHWHDKNPYFPANYELKFYHFAEEKKPLPASPANNEDAFIKLKHHYCRIEDAKSD